MLVQKKHSSRTHVTAKKWTHENTPPTKPYAVHTVHKETDSLHIKSDNTASRDLAPYASQCVKTHVHVDVLRRMVGEPTWEVRACSCSKHNRVSVHESPWGWTCLWVRSYDGQRLWLRPVNDTRVMHTHAMQIHWPIQCCRDNDRRVSMTNMPLACQRDTQLQYEIKLTVKLGKSNT